MITPTMGIPMRALGSVPVITLTTSPQRFTTNIRTASQYPQRRPRHNPIAVKVQAMQTAIISTMAAEPIRVNPARALGLRLQIGSRKLPGNVRDTAEMKLAHVPMANSSTSAITPKGRALVILDCKGTAQNCAINGIINLQFFNRLQPLQEYFLCGPLTSIFIDFAESRVTNR
jgi:hypothetical protein